ncbi:cell surface protein SprA, partial [Candidatus Zixiibacteriota bacterium]
MLVAVLFVFLPSIAQAIGMISALDQPGRTVEHFESISKEIGLSLSFSEIPLLNTPPLLGRKPPPGPRTETEINYYTGYVQLRSYFQNRHINNPLALEIKTFNALRNEGHVTDEWRKNIRLSLKKEQFQKKGSGIGWTFGNVPKSVRAILGEGGIGLKVNGYRKITFSGTSRWQGNVVNSGSYRQNKFPSLDMKQTSRFTINGNIGSKIHVSVDQDSKRESDLSNRIQIRYKGDEDDILQDVELGNTTLSLPNTEFVGYRQAIQGLFGVKATAKVGDLDLTMITSQEKGNTAKTRFTPGGAVENFTDIRDYNYLEGVYFDIGRFGPIDPDTTKWWRFVEGQDSIVDFKLFNLGRETGTNDPYARLSVDPTDSMHFDTPLSGSYVTEMELYEEYWYEPKEFWIRLEKRRYGTTNDILACWMRVQTESGIIEVGLLTHDNSAATRDTISLKLIKSTGRNAGDAIWDYEWKNVYYLNTTNIDPAAFELDIYKGPPGSENDISNLNHQDGTPYLQIFGLDVYNDNGIWGKPDDKIDNADYLLDLERGHLLFPNRRPFDPFTAGIYKEDTAFIVGNFPEGGLAERLPVIYQSSTVSELRDSSKYYIRIGTYGVRQAHYSLKTINILEGSETVTLDGRKLTRGVDYDIDYEFGDITFHSERALDPNAELTIDYEYAPFISGEKKTLFGMRASYDTGPNFKIGSSFLYKARKSTDRKPKLGQEKSKSMIGEVDFDYSVQPQWMTEMTNGLPLVETSAKSSLRISGEIARSMPDPNTEGQVILDDFEGVEYTTGLGRYRYFWTKSSPPDQTIWPNRTSETRCKLVWYNPFKDEFKSDEVYDREYDDNRTIPQHPGKVLVLEISPESTESWAGIMRPMGNWQQNEARLLEVRLGTYGDVAGQLHIDLGQIHEDLDGDGILDDENRTDSTGFKNDLLDLDEDTGLDGMTDEEEQVFYGYDPSHPHYDDPSQDNWYYDSNEDPDNYDRINGTEGNSNEGVATSKRPDTEDIGGDHGLDDINDYYSYTIDLLNSPYLVESSQYNAGLAKYPQHTDLIFRTYRIPLWGQANDPANAGRGDSTQIRFARIWLDGFAAKDSVYLAAMEIVKNTWKVDPVKVTEFQAANKDFKVEVINSEENADYQQDPPPGVSGYHDKQADLTEREQS